jgi:hypothetical protein
MSTPEQENGHWWSDADEAICRECFNRIKREQFDKDHFTYHCFSNGWFAALHLERVKPNLEEST